MRSGISICTEGHTTMLKWHRGRRHASDPAFTRTRIVEGMRLGASIEVDIRRHGPGGFVMLHDETLDRETDGSGPVAVQPAEELRQLHMRDNDGAVTAEPVLLLGDLGKLLAAGHLDANAVLQLDLKDDHASLMPEDMASFYGAVGPIIGHVLVSGRDAAAVGSLRCAAPGLRTGYDPCQPDSIAELRRTGDYGAFIEQALETAPYAEMIYLHHRIVLDADSAGFDMIGAIQAAGKRVDAWTIEHVNETTLPLVRRLLALKVDQITTDDPAGLGAAIAQG